jgi:hypothetical protein
MQSISASGLISLDARSRGGNVEIPDMKTAYAGH